jgi:hypothetical protein
LAGNACISNEDKDNRVIEYYTTDDIAADLAGELVNSDYDTLSLTTKSARLTSRAVSKFGIKTFPGLGSYGFFKYAYTGDSKILVPINAKITKMSSPTIVVTASTSTLNVVITQPSDIDYMGYKIILKNGEFRYEYATYETTVDIPIPVVKGTYSIYCIGYVNEGERVSLYSNVVEYTVTTGNDDFTPDQLTVDVNLSTTSHNPVENMKVTTAINEKMDNGITSTTAYTVSSNITMSSLTCALQGNLLILNGSFESSVDISNVATSLFTIDLEDLGIDSMVAAEAVAMFSDDNSSVLMAYMQSDGEVFTYGASPSLPANSNVNFTITGIVNAFD